MTTEMIRFKNMTREQVEELTEREFHDLSIFEKVEYFLIVNGYADHQCFRKMEIADVYNTGYLGINMSVICTKKRCRNADGYFTINMTEEHGGQVNSINYVKC